MRTRVHPGSPPQSAGREKAPARQKGHEKLQLALEVRQDIKRLLALGGISLAFIIAQTTPALAAMDRDNAGHSNSLERNVTLTDPRDIGL